MPPLRKVLSLWVNWLFVVSAGVALFGFALVVAPSAARQGFSLLVYAEPERISAFDEQAVRYISLVHAVLGAVMFAWGTVLVVIVRTLIAHGSRIGWQIVTFSLVAWFVPDTAYSLWSGFWQNAVLNLVFALLFVVPLVAIYQACNELSSNTSLNADAQKRRAG
jgi:hypothetical protein